MPEGENKGIKILGMLILCPRSNHIGIASDIGAFNCPCGYIFELAEPASCTLNVIDISKPPNKLITPPPGLKLV